MSQRVGVYETTGTVYQRQFATMLFMGLIMFVFGGLLMSIQIPIAGGTLIVLGSIFVINAFSYKRAGNKFKQMATEDRHEALPS
jgi:hypothetical protein